MSDETVITWDEDITAGKREYELARADIANRGLVTVDGDYLVLAGWYRVPINELKRPVRFFDWLFHLREKQWFSPQMQDDFLGTFEMMVLEDGNEVIK